MKFEAKEITLKNGEKCIFKSPEKSEAEAMIEYLKKIFGETHFLLRYPEEVRFTIEQEEEILENCLSDENAVMICSYIDGKIVGNAAISSNYSERTRHRGSVMISIDLEHQSLGMGSAFFDQLIVFARKRGYEQLELGVFSDNEKAIGLYTKKGFKEYGRIPNAFKLRDNSYRDEILMYLNLKEC